MKTLFIALVTTTFLASGANAATIGVNCQGKANIIIAPTSAEAEICAMHFGCGIGFSVNGGYYAIASTGSKPSQSASAGGFRKQTSAAERAIERCQEASGKRCHVTSSGHDDSQSYHNCQIEQ